MRVNHINSERKVTQNRNILTTWCRNIEVRCKTMDVATNTVAAVRHAKHPNDWDFSLYLAGHASNC